jgi:hypothetical protein
MAPPKPDPLYDPIYLAVGRGIEKWSWVESNLATLFEGLLGHRKDNCLGAAFYAAQSFATKLDMVDAVAQMRLSNRRLLRWRTLYNKTKNKAKKRNEIAHFALVHYPRAGVRLHPYWAIQKGDAAVKGKGLTAEQLEERAQSFTALSVEILRFYRALPKRIRRQPKRRPSKP